MFKIFFITAALATEAQVELDDFEIEDDEPVVEVSKKRKPRRQKPQNDDSAALEVDNALTENQRTQRMKACLEISRQKLEANDEVVSEMLNRLTSGLAGAQFSAQQAMEYVNMDFVKNCYLSIKKEEIDAFHASPASWRAANENRILLPDESKAHIRTLHQRQWDLLKDILKAEAGNKGGKVNPESVATSRVSGLTQIAYIILILGGVFGLGYWGLLKLTQIERERVLKKEMKNNKRKVA